MQKQIRAKVNGTGEVEPGPASNKWYNTWAECKGIQARVGTNTGTFSVPNVPVDQWGENILTVTVTDVSGNSSTQQRRVIKQVTDASETFKYDGNGNLTNWVCGSTNWVYEWDWADRLSKVTSNGVVVLENWYDAASHRIAKAEIISGSTTSLVYLYDGWDIVGLTTSTGALYDSFTRGVALAGDIGGLVAMTRANQRFYLHNNHRGDVIAMLNGTTTTATYTYSAFGSLIAQTGSDLCRFKFSTKERDPSTGLLYYGYRFYAPQWQRWMNADPAGERAGLNLSLFVGNMPSKRIDLVGLLGIGPGYGCLDADTDGVPGNSCPRKKSKQQQKCEASGGKWVTYAEAKYSSWDECVRAEGFGSWPGIIGTGIGVIVGGRLCGDKGSDIGGVVGGIIGGTAWGSFKCGGMTCKK